ncbi:E3 ubiquitin-protein ligase TRIM39-like isoform X2 [Pleurodeles waltl]|uniref:E3 ubiquitin-protein ligase TRIM39-like isoform X2 n=1 Tax=Pleurodeles waltl TaxID=8319 RepID=UPI003709BA7D
MASRRAQRMNQTRGTSDAASQARGGREIPCVRKQAIALGVMVAVTTFINIVLYRLVEREVFYRPRVQSCAGLQGQARDGQGSFKNPPLSLLKTSLCLRTVSQCNLHDRQGALPGQSCPWVRNEPGTEDSSSWRDLQPHLRETLCLHKVLVTLDPDTAYLLLALSEDRRRVAWTDRPQRRPDNPKRFTGSPCVLGREGFTSGRHYWEVQPLQEQMRWSVGVAQESVRRERTILSPERGVWAVSHWWGDGQYSALSSPRTPLRPRQPPLKLGLYLDYEGGRLSLYNADTWEHLCTFNDSFTGGLRPYFCVNAGEELRLV